MSKARSSFKPVHAATLCMFLKLELCLAKMMNLVYFTPFDPVNILRTRQDRNYINTCIRIMEVREFSITFINKNLKARRIEYKMETWLQIMKTKTEVAKQNKRKKKKKSCPKSISFLLLFFLGEGPWFAKLQPPRILDLLPWSHPWLELGGLPKQFPLWYPLYLWRGLGEQPGARWHQGQPP